MENRQLLENLLNAENEEDVLQILKKENLLETPDRWCYLGNTPNNQSIVQNQQSSASAALIEKITNGIDALLLRQCKERGIDPRAAAAPQAMAKAVEEYFGDLSDKDQKQIRELAEENLVLYATGSKLRPCLSLFDAGEGQLAEHFPKTFCSLIYGDNSGSYKGAIPFVQGKFNMGSSGVLPFCSDKRKLQLIVSRVPDQIAKTSNHEWAFTVFCFFHSQKDPSWKYLLGPDRKIMTGGTEPMGLVPRAGGKSEETLAARERKVKCGTLIKMYDYKAPRSNICGELYKKIEEYLLRPALPLRVVECRSEYKANVMGVTVWDRLGKLSDDKLEKGFEDGASITITLSTGEDVSAEVRVFKKDKDKPEEDNVYTGLRALINGQSHGRRDAQFFRNKNVDKEHVAGSMLVTLDCNELGQESRNDLFMSNRETFRESDLLKELFKKLQKELKDHEGLEALNKKRYEEKIASAVDDEDGLDALEELLQNDPELADLFGSFLPGKASVTSKNAGSGKKIEGEPEPFVGLDFPTFFKRADGSTVVDAPIPYGEPAKISFRTDVASNYFSRRKHRGKLTCVGEVIPTFHLFNGRLTFTFPFDKQHKEGFSFTTEITITDNAGSGPFKLTINADIVAAKPEKEKTTREPSPPQPPTVNAGPSRPNVKEVKHGPDAPPLTISRPPGEKLLQLLLNVESKLLADAKALRPKEEEAAVAFVFKYGLALVAMGLLDTAQKTTEWIKNEEACRDKIQQTVAGVARVIVPLCLSLPRKLPKQ